MLVRITNVLVNKHMCEYIICVDECNRCVGEHNMSRVLVSITCVDEHNMCW